MKGLFVSRHVCVPVFVLLDCCRRHHAAGQKCLVIECTLTLLSSLSGSNLLLCHDAHTRLPLLHVIKLVIRKNTITCHAMIMGTLVR